MVSIVNKTVTPNVSVADAYVRLGHVSSVPVDLRVPRAAKVWCPLRTTIFH